MGDTPGIVRFSPGIAEIYDLKSVVFVKHTSFCQMVSNFLSFCDCIPHIYIMGNNAYLVIFQINFNVLTLARTILLISSTHTFL